MNGVNRTLYIPLYGKAYVSKKRMILLDPKAETIWSAANFSLSGKAKSKWLAYYLSMRAAVFDEWLRKKMQEFPDAVIIHLGCGLDSRVERVGNKSHIWLDVDFLDVIEERRTYYQEDDNYRMVGSDVRDLRWMDAIPECKRAIVVMEGLTMYLRPEELQQILRGLSDRFSQLSVLMDCYTVLAQKMSKLKNPIHVVGASEVYGVDDPKLLEKGTGIRFVKQHPITPAHLIAQLQGAEKKLFERLYAGKTSEKLCRMYEFESIM